MTVTFVVGNDTVMDIPNCSVTSSEYINDVMLHHNLPDVCITVPKQYTHVFNIYLDFLHNNNCCNNIKDVDTLLQCFNMESYFSDNKFFEYLMYKAYPLWQQFVPIISQTPDERLVYLHSPHEFVPSHYMDRESFFNLWLEINKNTILILNGNSVYYTDVSYTTNNGNNSKDESKQHIKELSTYHTINSKKIGYEYKKMWCEDGQLDYEQYYNNGKQHGVYKSWYQNGQIESRYTYKDELFDGLQEAWYPSGKPWFQESHKDGKIHGIQQEWGDPNGETISYKFYNMGQFIHDLP